MPAAYQIYELDDRILRQETNTDLAAAIRYDTSEAIAVAGIRPRVAEYR
jgi:hypothetical protein